MTRKELLACLKQRPCTACKFHTDNGCSTWSCVFEEEPTTKNDLAVDCISRQAVNGYIDYILSHGMGKKKSFDFIKKFVTKLPSVTPQEPKIGHWIYLKHNKAKCSECDDVVLIAQTYGNANYCPNCGAKMVEPQESEE